MGNRPSSLFHSLYGAFPDNGIANTFQLNSVWAPKAIDDFGATFGGGGDFSIAFGYSATPASGFVPGSQGEATAYRPLIQDIIDDMSSDLMNTKPKFVRTTVSETTGV